MGWGEGRRAEPVPVVLTGTAREVDLALKALEAVGINGKNLAAAAVGVAEQLDRYETALEQIARCDCDAREVALAAVTRHVRQEDTASGAPVRTKGGFVPCGQ